MARPKRHWISQEVGSYHIISRVAGGELILNNGDKEYFLRLLERFSAGFFIQIHAFCIMSNHFHILATCMEREANSASIKELYHRYSLLYPKNPGPPEGTFDETYQFIPDEDGGIRRLRKRLGSVSSFIQELKQQFSRWYNKKYNRTGYLWGGRFKGIAVSKGEAQLVCSAYIDLNPVRASIVQQPEEYRWCSLGLRIRTPGRARKFLSPLSILPTGGEVRVREDGRRIETLPWLAPLILPKKAFDHFYTYREFVYSSGAIEVTKKSNIWPKLLQELNEYHDQLGVSDRIRYRLRNFSEGIAFGNFGLIVFFQELWKRKHIRPRSFMGRNKDCNWSFTTRVLRL